MKFTTTSYANNKEILKFGAQDYVAHPCMVSATGITADEDGKKIVKAGSILDKNGAIVNDGTAEGVLLYDVDVTHGDAPGALVVFGFIDGTKLPVSALTADCQSALKLIKFYDITTA